MPKMLSINNRSRRMSGKHSSSGKLSERNNTMVYFNATKSCHFKTGNHLMLCVCLSQLVAEFYILLFSPFICSHCINYFVYVIVNTENYFNGTNTRIHTISQCTLVLCTSYISNMLKSVHIKFIVPLF